MTDFLYSTERREPGGLAALLRSMPRPEPRPEPLELHGDWGSLGVLPTHHDGFEPLETEAHVVVVACGPLVEGGTSAAGSEVGPGQRKTAAAAPGLTAEPLAPGAGLRGPFAALVVDKARRTARVVTDLLSAFPAYLARPTDGPGLVVGTHVDAVARLAGVAGAIDEVSLADFLLNHYVTFPHTVYQHVEQLPPSSACTLDLRTGGVRGAYHWVPEEARGFATLDEAAAAVRECLLAYTRAVCAGCDEVGLFLSGGEDSRAVLGSVPPGVRVRGLTATDRPNRESRIAGRVARAYGASWVHWVREPDRYLHRFDAAIRLSGCQRDALQVHMAGLDARFGFERLPAVLGGQYSDALLKGRSIPGKSFARRGEESLPSPPRDLPPEPHGSPPAYAAMFRPDLVDAVAARRLAHFERVRAFRPNSAGEWIKLWPITQRQSSNYVASNLRWFRAYEVFLDSELVRLAAVIPQEWKINRGVFRRATRPLLRRGRFVEHPSGHLPSFGPTVNRAVVPMVRAARKLRRLALGEVEAEQGPWPIWERVVAGDAMAALVARAAPSFEALGPLFRPEHRDVAGVLGNPRTPPVKRVMLLQALTLLAESAGGGPPAAPPAGDAGAPLPGALPTRR